MPSTLLGQPVLSGPQLIVSGNPYSGQILPVGGVQLVLSIKASGSVYVGLSGNTTFNSGGYYLSGGGNLDGVEIGPGMSYFIPKVAFRTSGVFNVYAHHDVACSGLARLFWEVY